MATPAIDTLDSLRENVVLAKRKRDRQSKFLGSEVLEPRHLLTSNVIISEFVAANDSTLDDFQGDSSDWLELFNDSDVAVDLNGWHLTDDADSLNKWRLPATTIGPNEYLVVFASGKDLANPTAELHTNFKLSSDGEYLALVESDGTVAQAYNPFPKQSTDVSYGVGNEGQLQYFNTPTPGAENADPTEAPSGEVTYSVTGRTFAESFDLLLSSPAANAEIRFTLDGSIPDEESELYTEPFRITNSIRIRARAFEPGKSAGPVSSQGYIEVGNELLDFEGGEFDSNLPLMVFHSFGGSVDSNALNLVPVSSVFINNDGGRAGILDEPEFAGRAGLRIRGQSSQGWPKKQYALEIWEEGNSDTRPIRSQNADDRSVSIFGLPSESDWVLNGPYADKTQLNNFLTFNWSRQMGQYAPRTRQVEVFVKTTSGALNMRRDYRGTYVLLEKIKIDADRVDITELAPSATEEPEISGGYIWKYDKNGAGDVNFTSSFQSRAGTSRQWKFVEPQRPPTVQRDWLKAHLTEFETALYGRNFADPENGYAKYIDVESWIDTWILVEFTKNIDGFRLSTYYHKDVGDKIKQGPTWDFNLSLANANYLRGAFPDGWYHEDLSRGDYPYWDRLFDDPNFELRVRDRWFELRETMFSTENLLGAIDAGVERLTDGNPNFGEIAPGEPSNPVSRNFDRWGTLDRYLWPNCFFGSGTCPPSPLPDGGQPDSYEDYVFILRDFVQRRAEWIDGQFEKPPSISPRNELALETVEVTIVPPSGGVVYYTLDGTDPRDALTDGESDSAIEYTGPFRVTENSIVQSRSIQRGVWSARASQVYFVEIPTIAISEVSYNPADPTVAEVAAGYLDNDDFEYVELVNFGSDPVQLAGMKATDGIEVVLDAAMLQAGQRAVVVRNRDAFQFRYGDDVTIVGQYGNDVAELDSKLQNSGELIALQGPLGEPIDEVDFSDDWYPLSDGDGFSITRREPVLSPSDGSASEWQPSGFVNGSPGLPEPGQVPAPGDIVINEVASAMRGASRDVIELRNRTDTPVSVGGFFLSDDEDAITKFRIAPGTVIPANGYVELDQTNLGASFQVDPQGGRLLLRGAMLDGTLTGFQEVVDYGLIAPNRSWGRVETSIGSDFGPMALLSIGEENSSPQIGPVVINEIQYNPAEDGHEFIELRNLSTQSARLDGWKFDRGIRYEFPSGASIPGDGFVVLVQTESTDAASNAELVANFRTTQNVPADVGVFLFEAEANGSLSNGGEALVLKLPTSSTDSVEADRIVYSDESPWISRADGFGPSLSRVEATLYGNDPGNWRTSTGTGTPGRDNVFEDATPPTVPQNLAALVLEGGGVGLGWTPSIDEDGRVDHYVIYRDGKYFATTPIPFYRDIVAWGTGGVSYQVAAVNADGFESDATNVVDVRANSTSFRQGESYDGAADSRIRESVPDATDGIGRRLTVDGNATGSTTEVRSSVLMRWSDLEIPEGSSIVGATVTLNIINSGDDYDFKPIRQDWDELQVTWNQAAEGRLWQTPGMLGDADVGETIGVLETLGSGVVVTSFGDLGKELVQGWIDQPSTNHGIAIVDPGGSTDNVSIESAQTRIVDMRPKLTILHVPSQEQVQGDFNFDGVADSSDIDSLNAAVRAGVTDSIFDVNADGAVQADDVDYLLQNVIGTLRGDVNLDGTVGFADFLLLSSSFGANNGAGWSDGDVDGDGAVLFVDFLLMSTNFGSTFG